MKTNKSKNKKAPRVYFVAATPSNQDQRVWFAKVQDMINLAGGLVFYDWLNDNGSYTPAALRQKNIESIQSADLVVAEVTNPSVGLGQQIEYALSKKIPVIALHDDADKQISRFLAGSESDLFHYVRYQKEKLQDILIQQLRIVIDERLMKFNFISTPEINAALEEESENRGMSRSQLVRLIIRDWLYESGAYTNPLE